jgi:hypothetical protein
MAPVSMLKWRLMLKWRSFKWKRYVNSCFVIERWPKPRLKRDQCRVARWFVFKPKIPIWVNFLGPEIGKCWYILWPFGIFYIHLGNFMIIWVHCVLIWYIFSIFGFMYQDKSGNPGLKRDQSCQKVVKTNVYDFQSKSPDAIKLVARKMWINRKVFFQKLTWIAKKWSTMFAVALQSYVCTYSD